MKVVTPDGMRFNAYLRSIFKVGDEYELKIGPNPKGNLTIQITDEERLNLIERLTQGSKEVP